MENFSLTLAVTKLRAFEIKKKKKIEKKKKKKSSEFQFNSLERNRIMFVHLFDSPSSENSI